jgi:hypothetical protein
MDKIPIRLRNLKSRATKKVRNYHSKGNKRSNNSFLNAVSAVFE